MVAWIRKVAGYYMGDERVEIEKAADAIATLLEAAGGRALPHKALARIKPEDVF